MSSILSFWKNPFSNKSALHYTFFSIFHEKHFLTMLQPVWSYGNSEINWWWQSIMTSLKCGAALQSLSELDTRLDLICSFLFICSILWSCQRNSVLLFKWCLSSKNCTPNRYTFYRGVASPTIKMSQFLQGELKLFKGHSSSRQGNEFKVWCRIAEKDGHKTPVGDRRRLEYQPLGPT